MCSRWDRRPPKSGARGASNIGRGKRGFKRFNETLGESDSSAFGPKAKRNIVSVSSGLPGAKHCKIMGCSGPNEKARE